MPRVLPGRQETGTAPLLLRTLAFGRLCVYPPALLRAEIDFSTAVAGVLVVAISTKREDTPATKEPVPIDNGFFRLESRRQHGKPGPPPHETPDSFSHDHSVWFRSGV